MKKRVLIQVNLDHESGDTFESVSTLYSRCGLIDGGDAALDLLSLQIEDLQMFKSLARSCDLFEVLRSD